MAPAPNTIPWRQFVAVGDSVTEGVGDPTPGGLRGWADRLADALASQRDDFIYEKLAVRGLLTREITASQLQRALELKPDLTSAIAGMNDLIRSSFDPEVFRDELSDLVGPLAATDATVLTATFPDVTRFLLIPRRYKTNLRNRLLDANQIIREVAATHDTLLVDAEDLPDSIDPRSFSVDRLHPGPRGHLLIARAFAELLSIKAGVPIELPSPDDGPLGANKLAQARWIVSQTTPLEILRFVKRTTFAR